MANHGMVAVGESLEQAFAVAEQIEYVARLYIQAKSVGEPVILGDDEMTEVLEKFQTYGQQDNSV
jgi:L-fuculose-phosphate aldolase